jgi:hypothetical protein
MAWKRLSPLLLCVAALLLLASGAIGKPVKPLFPVTEEAWKPSQTRL